tara:strand:+ start:395 stop:823 length:429 start_codon:yes stop_codon:yes gene_type:complete
MTPYSKELIQALKDLVDSQIDIPIPYAKGNSIRLKHIIIRKHRNGYRIFDLNTNKIIANTFSKTGAVAIAKCVVDKQEQKVKEILGLDQDLAKFYNDAVFYKHTIEHTTDDLRRDAAFTRFEIANDKAMQIKYSIESFIYDK